MPEIELYQALRTTRGVRKLRSDPIPDAVCTACSRLRRGRRAAAIGSRGVSWRCELPRRSRPSSACTRARGVASVSALASRCCLQCVSDATTPERGTSGVGLRSWHGPSLGAL